MRWANEQAFRRYWKSQFQRGEILTIVTLCLVSVRSLPIALSNDVLANIEIVVLSFVLVLTNNGETSC